jgi:hypothetical protein
MPRPVYIIGCDTIIEDKATNFVSAVSIMEKVVAIKQPTLPETTRNRFPSTNESQVFKCWVLAVWMWEAGDTDVEYLHEFSIINPSGDKRVASKPHPFKFIPERPLQRFKLFAAGGFPDHSGFLQFESRVTSGDFTRSQSYPLQIEIVEAHPESDHESISD